MIFLVRHGQTEWNKALVFRGRKDVPLSAEGKIQAARTGKYLRGRSVSQIFTSPLTRALGTANAIAKESQCAATILEALTDVHFGDWEGKTLEWVKQNDPKNYFLYLYHPEEVVFPNGESLDSCCNRAFDAFYTELHSRFAEHNDEGDCVFVTHRVVLKLLLLRAMGLSSSSFWKLQVDTCGLSELDLIDNTFIIKRINSVCHLSGAAQESADF
jgi:broad specificity phosphatase PhoE